jgi:CheY-like chemotaxis protein
MSDPKRKKVMIVEDTDSVQMMMKRWVMNAGYDVEVASDGLEALEKMKSETPDLILLDLMLPGLNGYAVCRQLREREETKKTPVIIMTALRAPTDSDEAYLSGANEVVIKPLAEAEIVRKIRHYLGSVFR